MPSFVYIMTTVHNTALYTGVTSDLVGRVWQHRNGQGGKFSSTYRTTKLVYYEAFSDIVLAIEREKKIKGSSRAKKLKLIRSVNPTWSDLGDEI